MTMIMSGELVKKGGSRKALIHCTSFKRKDSGQLFSGTDLNHTLKRSLV